MKAKKKILVLGAKGLVGSALVRELTGRGYQDILNPARSELNLMRQTEVEEYFAINRPEWVIDAAAKVGGVLANNKYRADFILENLTIQNNVFSASYQNSVQKLLFLGSSCIYPKNSPQPMKEEHLLTGPFEPTNEPYAVAKVAGLKMAESFRRQYGCNYFSVMPTNLYGPNDNFHKENSHVIPGLIARMTEAKEKNEPVFRVWGTGKPRREFLHVDDLARACCYLMECEGDIPYFINVGYGEDISISELAHLIAATVGYSGKIEFDSTYPDGVAKKLMDSSKMFKLGWKPKVSLEEGLKEAVDVFVSQKQRGILKEV